MKRTIIATCLALSISFTAQNNLAFFRKTTDNAFSNVVKRGTNALEKLNRVKGRHQVFFIGALAWLGYELYMENSHLKDALAYGNKMFKNAGGVEALKSKYNGLSTTLNSQSHQADVQEKNEEN